jgi:tetratricopeptide (TPR) repeat protein
LSLGRLQRYEEALDTAHEAVSVAARNNDASSQVESLFLAAWSLGQLGRHEDAVATANKAALLAASDNNLFGHVESLRVAALSLNQLGRHEDAVATVREAAAIAARDKNFARQAEVLRLAASWTQTAEQATAVLSTALDNQRAALKNSNDEWLIDATIATLLAACWVPSNEAITAFGVALSRLGAAPESQLRDLLLYCDDWFAAAARANAWSDADAVLAEHGKAMLARRGWLDVPQIGIALGRVAADEGRAVAFEATREVLIRLRRLLPVQDEAGRDSGRDFRVALTNTVNGLANASRDGGLLRDVAGLLTAELSPDAPEQATLLLELAALDEAADPQARLTRVDPDVAVWLSRIRNLPVPNTTRPRAGSEQGTRKR